MGTSKSYSGGGGKPGKQLRTDVENWLDQQAEDPDDPSHDQPDTSAQHPPQLDPNALLNAVTLIRPRISGGSSDGPSGGGGGGGGSAGGGGGARRTVAGSAGTAGRAAAAAYAYATGNADALADLGLDLNELRGLDDPGEVSRRIVEAACGPRRSSIEDHEQRLVAAEVAEWIFNQSAGGDPPGPEEITRHAIALIVADTVIVETAQLATARGKADVTEQVIRDAAEALAARAEFTADGVTEAAFEAAIESGIETLRGIVDGDS